MVQHQKAMSLKESKEVMKKFKGPPIINLSKSDCKKGRMQKVLKKYNETIRLNPLTVFRFPQKENIQFHNPNETYLKVVKKKRTYVKNRIFSHLLFDSETKMTVADYIRVSNETSDKDTLIKALYKKDTQYYSENNDDIDKFLCKDEIGMKWDLNEENGLRKSVVYPGINQAEIYFGKQRTFSTFHQEDGDLLSANYHIHGKTKIWWAVPREEKSKLMDFCHQLPESQSCHNFWRHKSHVINFAELQKRGIQVIEYEQNPGDLVVTNGWHMTANEGFNVNVAINCAIEGESWTLELIEKSVDTMCTSSCLYKGKSLDMSQFQIEPLYCDACEKGYRSDYGYNKHFEEDRHKNLFKKKYPGIEYKVQRNTECPYCHKHVKRSMKYHVKTVHPEKMYRKMCTLCREIFENEDKRFKHWNKGERPDKSGRAECRFCSKKFKYYMEAIKHECISEE